MALLHIQLLGNCEFRERNGRPLPLTARKSRALLAFLALQAGAPQSREKLAALLWEDADAELARTSLRQALSAIRRALPEAAQPVLVADAMQVSLDVSHLEVDLLELRALLGESTLAALKAARSRAVGALLEGFDARSDAFEEWLSAERRTLRRDVAAAMQRLARLCRDLGDLDNEIDALTRQLALEPVNELAHRELMEAHARAGRYTDALHQYQQCRAILRRELDLSPEPATETLYRELMKRRRAAADDAFEASHPDVAYADEQARMRAVDERLLRNGVVLTARLIGLGDYRRGLDPEAARELGQKLQQAFAARVAENGGVADRMSGDRVHAVFGLENLSGNEPQRALRTAAALHQAFADSRLPLPGIAVGIAQGALLPGHEDGPFPLSGHAMSEAEALAARAAPGDTLLADELRRALLPRAAPFAGRTAELSLTVSLFERTVASGRGRTILIRGEAGIGKTRLLEELANVARAKGAGCHRVQVLDFGQIKARRPLAALFSSLLGLAPEATPEERGRAVADAIAKGLLHADDILHASGLAGAPLSPDQASIDRNVDAQALEHGRLDAVRRLIEASCRQAPLLLIIEDLHYAGGEEAARLGELAASVAAQRALLVMSTRPDEDPIDAAWRARARGCPLTTLDLAPLTDDEARELTASYPHLPEAVAADCIARAQGHPLFLDQLLRAADAGERALPSTVQALVLSRVERLERADRQTLIAASVLGLRFPREALLAMQETPVPLTPLVDAGLLTDDGSEFAFIHALMREAVYGSLLKSNRRELHARAAAWYAGRDAGLRAGHLAEAGDPGAARACLEAANAEAEALRLDRALEFAQKASSIARDPADFGLARCLLGELQTRTGHTHDAITTMREVIELRPDALTEARARIGLANALRIVDRYDEALAALERAEAALKGLDRPEILARIWTMRGNIHFPRGKLDDCLAAHECALEFARTANSPVDEARAQGGLGDARYQRGHMIRARDHFARCVAEARQHGAVGLALSHAPMLGITRAYCGEIRQGLADLDAAVAAARQVGDPRSELIGRVAGTTIALFCGEYERVRAASDRGLALARQLGARRFEAELMTQLGHALEELGGAADAQVLLHQATTLALEVAPTYCGPWCLGVQALYTANVERAKELLTQGEALLAQGCVSHNHLEFRRLAMEHHLRHGDIKEVRRHAAALTAYTSEEPLPWSELVVRRGEWLADRADDPSRADLPARRETLLADIEAMDFGWLRRGL